jgi:hypothetical protein
MPTAAIKGIWTQTNQRWHNGGIISGSVPAVAVAPAVRHAAGDADAQAFLVGVPPVARRHAPGTATCGAWARRAGAVSLVLVRVPPLHGVSVAKPGRGGG